MKQTKMMSFLESLINIAVGFGISLLAQVYFLPLLGVTISFEQNLHFAAIMTVISILRSFALRRLFEALHIRKPLSAFARAVMAERHRQIDGEGWSAAHDDAHHLGELAAAGASYGWRARMHAVHPRYGTDPEVADLYRPNFWPWDPEWWKPKGIRRDLVRAAALIIAEGERYDRLRHSNKSVPNAGEAKDD